MLDTGKTREQLIEELVDLRQSLIDQGRANLLLGNSRTISTKRFAAGIAHEINNPLGIISGFAELALLNVGLPQSARDDLRVIHSECNRAARVLHDLLTFAGDRPLNTASVNVQALTMQALKLKSNEFDLYHINVITHYAPDLPQILADQDQLIEVLLNLLDNAQQAMTEAHGGGQLEITTDTREDRVRISISDNGPGISQADLVRIFHPFFTTKDVGKGSGLGLSISQGIIQQHGGDIWAESTENVGSSFHLEIPIIPVASTGKTPVQAPEPQPAQTSVPTKRILVVNDELGFRQLLSRALAPGGHLVDLAGDWAQAWDLVQHNSYHCVILNLGLPAVNGMQLFERIRGYDSDLAARCVFITGYLLTPELEASLVATGVPYLTKPFAISQIRNLVLETSSETIQPV